jgi:subtilase family serine protease
MKLSLSFRNASASLSLSCIGAAALAAGLLGSGRTASAQKSFPVYPVQPEFRTAPRSLITEKVDRTRMVKTPGALNPIVSKYQDQGEVDPSLPIMKIQLLLQRPAERQAAFDAQVEALHTPGSTSYHKWLVPETVGAEFGPSASDIATVVSYLQSEGFTVNNVGKSGLYIDFKGTAAQVEHTFQTKIHAFAVPEDGSHEVKYSGVQDAVIPEALAPAVVGLVGLSNVRAAFMNHEARVPPAMSQLLPLGISSDPSAKPMDTESGPTYDVGPKDFYTIYNETPLLTASTPINGSGVTIALLEESAINTADVTYFRNYYGVSPATPVSMVVDTGYGANTCTAPAKISGEEGEADLDIQWAGVAAPSANLLFMQCAAGSILGVFYSAEAVIDNNLADVMSLSYGQYEGYSTTQDNLAAQLWEQAASQGETVVVSAGDSGAATEDGNYGDSYAKYGLTTSSFSSTAWNVSAGGTDFQDTFNGLINSSSSYQNANYWNTTVGTLNSAKSYIPETTWNDSCGGSLYSYYYYGAAESNFATFCGANAATKYTAAGGAGASNLHTRPTWQTSTVYGLPTTTAYPQRLQPDVSLFASNGWWGHALPSYESDSSTSMNYAGGTSYVAPQLAGIFALIQQKTGQRQGQPNYVLYKMAGIEYGTTTATSACNGSGAANNGLTGSPVTTSTPSSTCIFYDVTTGTSSVVCSKSYPNCFYVSGKTYGVLSTAATGTTGTPAYSTNTGWDLSTGIGSMNITNLVNNWQSATLGGLETATVVVGSTVSTYVYGHPSAATLTATVSGTGSYPTGSVTFSASPTVGTIGTDALVGSTACSNTGTCVESATQSYTAAGTLPVTTYTITGAYLTTNENYIPTATGTTTFIITKQTPTLSVSSLSAAEGSTATLTATVAYTGTGNAPTGAVTLKVGSTTVTATCAQATLSLSCSASFPTAGIAPGAYTITGALAADTNYVTAGNTGTLTVTADPLSTLTVAGILPYSYDGTSYSFTVTSAGVNGTNPDTGFTGTVALTSTDPLAVITPSSYKFTSSDAGVHTFTVTYGSTGTPYVTATAGSVSGSESTIIAKDYIWLVNLDGTEVKMTESGTGVTGSVGISGTASAIGGVAFDSTGTVWDVSSQNNTLNSVSKMGTSAVSYSGGGLSSPVSVAVDGAGMVWVANSGNGTLSLFSNSGTPVNSTGLATAASMGSANGVAIDNAGTVWVINQTAGTVTHVFGGATPVVTPLSTATANGALGVAP